MLCWGGGGGGGGGGGFALQRMHYNPDQCALLSAQPVCVASNTTHVGQAAASGSNYARVSLTRGTANHVRLNSGQSTSGAP